MTLNPRRFALVGAAGFIANAHYKAIQDIGGDLVAAFDITDAGIQKLDFLFPKAKFFLKQSEFVAFIRLFNQENSENPIEFLSVCAPDYMHLDFCRLGLGLGCHVICEKPLVMNPFELRELLKLQELSRKRVFPIMQVRYHSGIMSFKNKLDKSDRMGKHQVEIIYLSPRGHWYENSWRGNREKSAGVIMDIGIHFFDALVHLFGNPKSFEMHLAQSNQRFSGFLELEDAEVKWYLSIDPSDPEKLLGRPRGEYRHFIVDGNPIDLSLEFRALHSVCYRKIINNRSMSVQNITTSLNLCYELSQLNPVAAQDGKRHPLNRASIGAGNSEFLLVSCPSEP